MSMTQRAWHVLSDLSGCGMASVGLKWFVYDSKGVACP